MQLRNELRGAHDGAGHQLREERKVKAEIQEVLHRLDALPLHVHRLESEEGDSHRQDDGIYPEQAGSCKDVEPLAQDIVHLQLQAEEVVHEIREEVRILEIGQDTQVHHHAESGERLSPPLLLEPV